MTFTRYFYFQIFMSDKIDMVISVALAPVALLSAPMLVAKKYVLSAFFYETDKPAVDILSVYTSCPGFSIEVSKSRRSFNK